MPNTTNFTADITSGNAPLVVTFTDLSTPTPTAWLWDFGDGNTSASQNPSHTYLTNGLFSVSLTPLNGSWVEYVQYNYINVTSILTGKQIKVQGGRVVYSTSTPGTSDLAFDLLGNLHVSKSITTGSGVINTTVNSPTDLELLSHTNGALAGNIKLSPAIGGKIVLNNTTWPSNTPAIGSLINVSSTNTLSFNSLVLGNVNSDSLTSAQLNSLYPNAFPGQLVAGPVVIYVCIAVNTWQITSGSTSVDKTAGNLINVTDFNNDIISVRDIIINEGNDNIFVGRQAGATSLVGGNNIIIGTEAGAELAIGLDNILIGFQAGDMLENGNNNIFIGQLAGRKQSINESGNLSSCFIVNNETLRDPSVLAPYMYGDMSPGGDLSLSATLHVSDVNGVSAIGITPLGEFLLDNNAGVAGEILTSNGPATAASWASPSRMNIKTVFADYTIVHEDSLNMLIRVLSASAVVVTIPSELSVLIPIGTAILLGQNGSGAVSIAGAAGVTVLTPDTNIIGRQYGKVTIIKTGPDIWELEGNLVAA